MHIVIVIAVGTFGMGISRDTVANVDMPPRTPQPSSPSPPPPPPPPCNGEYVRELQRMIPKYYSHHLKR